MPKIVYAPILEQAGFLKRKAAVVVEQWVAQLDGATQYWQLSEPIDLIAGDVIEIGFVGDIIQDSYKSFIASTDSNLRVATGADPQKFDLANTNYNKTKVNGITIINNTTLIPNSGMNILEFASYSNYLIKGFGARVNESGSAILHIALAFYNFRVKRNGVILNEIPLTNKAQGATQLATVGNINAFMPNYTEAVWRKP